MLLEISGEITPERMKRRSQIKNNTKLWMWLVMEARSDAVKNNTAQEPGMLGPWIKANWKWSNEMARVNIDILGISERNGMGEFNSDDHYIYYCRQESLRRNGVAITVNKRVRNAVLGCNLKNKEIISVRFQGKPFNITVIQVYAQTSYAEEAEVERFYEDLQDLLELTPKKDVLFIIGDWNAKVGSQEIPGVTGKFGPLNTKWSRAKANRLLPRGCTGHSKHPLPTTQDKTIHMDITRWSIPKSNWLYSLQPKMEKLYTVSKNKTGS